MNFTVFIRTPNRRRPSGQVSARVNAHCVILSHPALDYFGVDIGDMVHVLVSDDRSAIRIERGDGAFARKLAYQASSGQRVICCRGLIDTLGGLPEGRKSIRFVEPPEPVEGEPPYLVRVREP